MRRSRLILLATLALVAAAPASLPTTLPIDVLATVAQLADRDPIVRAAARTTLMSLDVDALPALRDALAGATLTRAQAGALRDAVVQVVLADKQRAAAIDAPTAGTLGVSVCATGDQPPVVGARMLGWDGYRVLEDGDAIVAMRVAATPGDARRIVDKESTIRTLADLRTALAATRPGDHVIVRLLRNGLPLDVEVRVAAKMDDPMPDGILRNRFVAEADKYWQTQFAAKLRIASPTTRAVQ